MQKIKIIKEKKKEKEIHGITPSVLKKFREIKQGHS